MPPAEQFPTSITVAELIYGAQRADLRIAAIVLSRGLTLVTRNVWHFRRVPGLAVENWVDDA